VIVALAAAAIVGSVLSGGGDDGSSSPSADRTPAEPAKPKAKKKKKKEQQAKAEEPAAAPTPAEPAPAEEESASYDPARGAQLNNEGFALMNQGSYDEAASVLQEAVNSFPPGTSDINYAYALYNLGRSLRLAGRPDEAIPILERRLQIPNQTSTVQRELDLAKQQAGQS
jgi:tetratricopeptide (TPR) repeat protein